MQGQQPFPALTTPRLHLTPLCLDDLDGYAALHADPDVMRHLTRGEPWKYQLSARHLIFMLGHWHQYGFGLWTLRERDGGAFCGVCGFVAPPGWPGFELAGRLLKSHWGRGYATEASQAALDWAFQDLRRDHVISLVDPQNPAPLRLLDRLGFTCTHAIDVEGRPMRLFRLHRDSHLGRCRPPFDGAGHRPVAVPGTPSAQEPAHG